MKNTLFNVLRTSEVKTAVAATAIGILLSESTDFFASKVKEMLHPASIKQVATTPKPHTTANTPSIVKELTMQNPESTRGLWVDRYSWKTKQDLTNLVLQAKASGINTLYFQVRGTGMDSTYASTIETNKYRYKEHGAIISPWDPLAYVTSLAHSNDIKVEAWMNLYTTNTRFIAANPQRKDWILPTQKHHADGYMWLNPNHPQVRAYLNEIIREVATQYEVDAIHLDRVRVPEKKFSTDITKEAITSHIKELNSIVHNEGKKLTAAVFGYQTGKASWGLAGGGSSERFAQDAAHWIEEDCTTTGPCVDSIVLMYYWALIHTPKERSFPEPILSEVLAQYQNSSRIILGLQTAPKSDPTRNVPTKDLHAEMAIGTKKLGGFALYDYDKKREIIPDMK